MVTKWTFRKTEFSYSSKQNLRFATIGTFAHGNEVDIPLNGIGTLSHSAKLNHLFIAIGT